MAPPAREGGLYATLPGMMWWESVTLGKGMAMARMILLLLSLTLVTATAAHAKEAAWCVYGKTTVESWDDAQMKVRYGSSACRLGGGDDARKFLERNFGGTNRPCSC
jgi:hypothetical protein